MLYSGSVLLCLRYLSMNIRDWPRVSRPLPEKRASPLVRRGLCCFFFTSSHRHSDVSLLEARKPHVGWAGNSSLHGMTIYDAVQRGLLSTTLRGGNT